MSDLRRLGSLAGIISDDLLRVAFVSGLPSSVSAQLRAMPSIKKMALSELVEIARALLSEIIRDEKAEQTDGHKFGAVASRQKWIPRRSETRFTEERGNRREVKCFECGGPHLRKWCKQRRCFKCGELGHLANSCQLELPGNGTGKPWAPADSQ